MIAPVLPGETLKNLLFQSRVVTDPIKNPLIGWWIEYYWMYVKHRDLAERDDLVEMVLDINFTSSGLHSAADTKTYHAANTANFTKMCLRRVVEEYFRNEGEAWDGFLLDDVPLASVDDLSWMDSAMNGADLPATSTDDGSQTATELDATMRTWELLRAQRLTDMTYEDWLRTYGVKGKAVEEPHKPELVRYVRQWQYPSNTIDPTNGTPRSAVSWSVAERADKDRFFAEPGFLIGCTVARPKVYFSGQNSSATHLLDNAFAWMPAIMLDDPWTSLRHRTEGSAPLPGISDDAGYWVDLRDLYLYGDQFVNFSLSETNAGLVALPTAAMQKRYAASADADALFVSASPANQIRQDGVTSLSILGRQVDHT